MKHSRVFAAFNRGVLPTITVINKATVSLGVDFTALVTVLQKYVDTCLVPVWGTPAHLTIAKDFVPGAWALVFLDTADVSSALGYHDLTPDGFPLSKVFVKTTLSASEKVSVVASHELSEMTADPSTNLCAQHPNGTMYAYETCLAGDTKIPLLDGSEKPISELVGQKDFFVYSCTERQGIAPGRVNEVRLTRKNAEIVKVSLDNGEVLKCTSDHRIMMRDGTYKSAGDLRPNDSLMPLYRRKMLMPKTKLDYEQVLVPALNNWEFTHRVIHPNCPRGYVRHHVDFDRFNNRPDNIELETWNNHLKLHGRNASISNKTQLQNGSHPFLKKKSEPHKEQLRRRCRETLSVLPKRIERYKEWIARAISDGTHPLLRQNRTQKMSEQSSRRITEYNKSDQHRQAVARVGRVAMRKLWERPDFREHHKTRSRKLMTACNANPDFQVKRIAALRASMHIRYHLQHPKENCPLCVSLATNHKVVRVESSGTADVYDLVVEKYHNFAVSAGVFVHNCDAVEAQWFYLNSIPMSDFVFPSWYEGFRAPNSTQFDYMNKVSAPFQLLAGGYAIVFRRGRWTNIFGSEAKRKAFAQEDRREHRSEYRKAPKL